MIAGVTASKVLLLTGGNAKRKVCWKTHGKHGIEEMT